MWRSVSASISCTETRIWFPDRRTLPSTTLLTPSWRAISLRLRVMAVLYCMTEVRLITFRSLILERFDSNSSWMPSASERRPYLKHQKTCRDYDEDQNRCADQCPFWNGRLWTRFLHCPCSFEFFRNLRIAYFVSVEIYGVKAGAVFDFAFAEIVQARLPLPILLQIFRDMPGDKDVSGIATIHHALRDVDSGAGNVRLFVQVSDFVNRPAVNSHANVQFRMGLECLA